MSNVGSSDTQFSFARSKLRRLVMILTVLLAMAVLIALGIWQLERRVWKEELIEQVNERVHAVPVAPPGPSMWSEVTASHDAYRRVTVHGSFLNDHETLVQAATLYGSGYWVLTPLQTDDGFIVLVNRGFVLPDKRAISTRVPVEGETIVTGLVRMQEPKGSLLRANNPSSDRWYSRDVEAIAAARKLSHVAPYFIDADDNPNPGDWPLGGLTVIVFPNNHLVYAMTWFGLALILAGVTLTAVWQDYRLYRKDC